MCAAKIKIRKENSSYFKPWFNVLDIESRCIKHNKTFMNYAYNDLNSPLLSSAIKSIFRVPIECFNNITGQCTPSNALIQDRTGYSRATVNRSIKKLKEIFGDLLGIKIDKKSRIRQWNLKIVEIFLILYHTSDEKSQKRSYKNLIQAFENIKGFEEKLNDKEYLSKTHSNIVGLMSPSKAHNEPLNSNLKEITNINTKYNKLYSLRSSTGVSILTDAYPVFLNQIRFGKDDFFIEVSECKCLNNNTIIPWDSQKIDSKTLSLDTNNMVKSKNVNRNRSSVPTKMEVKPVRDLEFDAAFAGWDEEYQEIKKRKEKELEWNDEKENKDIEFDYEYGEKNNHEISKEVQEWLDSKPEEKRKELLNKYRFTLLRVVMNQEKEDENKHTESIQTKREEYKYKKKFTDKVAQIEWINNKFDECQNLKEVLERSECNNKEELKNKMLINWDYDPFDGGNYEDFDTQCYCEYGLMSQRERDVKFREEMSYYMNPVPSRFSIRELNILHDARVMADWAGAKYLHWVAAQYDNIGHDKLQYTNLKSKNATKYFKEWKEKGEFLPRPIFLTWLWKRKLREKSRKYFGPKKDIVQKIKESQIYVENYLMANPECTIH